MNHDKEKIKLRSIEEKKNLTIRLNKIEGQIKGIKKMVEDDRYCDDILIQLSAIDKSIKSLANLMIENHLNSCVIEKIKSDDLSVIPEIVDLFKRFQ